MKLLDWKPNPNPPPLQEIFENSSNPGFPKFSLNVLGSFWEWWKNQECVWQRWQHWPWQQVFAILRFNGNYGGDDDNAIFAEKCYDNIKIIIQWLKVDLKKNRWCGDKQEYLQDEKTFGSFSWFLHLILSLYFPILSQSHFLPKYLRDIWSTTSNVEFVLKSNNQASLVDKVVASQLLENSISLTIPTTPLSRFYQSFPPTVYPYYYYSYC